MADLREYKDQLSNVNAFKNEDSKIIIFSSSYNELLRKYLEYKNTEINPGESSAEIPIRNNQEMWNLLSKSILICSPKRSSDDKSVTIDTGEYQIVVLAPDGRPVSITPPFSKIDDNYFSIINYTEINSADAQDNYAYKMLTLNIDKLLENEEFINKLKNKLGL